MLSKSPIIVSILTKNAAEFAERLTFAQANTHSVHIDVIDNDFCSGATLPVDEWPAIDINYSEVHLMVKNPVDYLIILGQKKITRAIIHLESNFNLEELTKKAKELDILLGWTVNPDTDLDRLRGFYETTTYIQVMGVQPGQSGQTLIDTTPLAINYLKRLTSRRLLVSVDGGVNLENISRLQQCGAHYFVVSQAVFGGDEPLANYQNLLAALEPKN